MFSNNSKIESKKAEPVYLLHQKKSTSSLYLAAVSAGCLENLLHPLDTAAKRLQKNTRFFSMSSEGIQSLKSVTLQDSLFRGFQAGLTYKMVQRSYVFGTQPIIKEKMETLFGEQLAQITNKKYTSTMTNSLAGAFVGLFEVSLLPLDTWKIKRQLGNKENAIALLKNEKGQLYRAAPVTALRNIKAHGTLFGFSDLIKQTLFDLKENETANFQQQLVSSIIASSTVVLITNPTDMIKTRVQASRVPTTATEQFSELMKKEGPKAFTKGIWPRLFTVVPRLTLVKVASEQLTSFYENLANK